MENHRPSSLCVSDATNTQLQIEQFFGTTLPFHVAEEIKDFPILHQCNQDQIMQTIDFTPPFLKTQKIVICGDQDSVVGTRSIGMGLIYPNDTQGHYNSTIYLAMCGWLMASSASVHLAILYPDTAPQAIEGTRIMPYHLPDNKGALWQPSEQGTVFFAESKVLKKRLQLVIVETKISFAHVLYGKLEQVKLVLTDKQSIWQAKPLPSKELI